VMIWSAVAASCSVPLIFSSSSLLVKDPATGQHLPWNPTPQTFIDGSVDNDLPMTRLAEMFNVNHFIVSQVNPHVVPFLSKDDRLYPKHFSFRLQQKQLSPDSSEWLYTLTSLAKDEALHRLHFLAELGVFPNLFTKLRSILSQKYSGDITILPEIAIQDLPRILSNPNAEFMHRNCLIGEQATWPKLSRIRDRCAIELALDRAVHALRARVVFSSSQVNLRRLAADHTQVAEELGVGVTALPQDLFSASQPINDESSTDQKEYGRRRNSGGSIQLMARHKKVLQNLVIALTDDDTEEEERLEPNSRKGVGRANVSKPRLKRSAKSQHHLSTYAGRLASPLPNIASTGSEAPPGGGSPFNFAKSLTPKMHGCNDSGVLVDDAAVETALEGVAKPSPFFLPPPGAEGIPLSRLVSPSDEATDPDAHTSDADVEDSRTDESETDPYDKIRQYQAGSLGVEAVTDDVSLGLLKVASSAPKSARAEGLWD
jgi:TAG lipase / steryl ester hydrolase / phospholipase A2 / LPA acyltransferase